MKFIFPFSTWHPYRLRRAWGLVALAAMGCARASSPVPPSSDPLAGVGAVEKVSGGFTFTEGPLWIEQSGYLLFSDVQANAIEKLTPPSAVQVFRQPSNAANGLAVDPQGLLVACEGGAHRVTRTLPDGTIEPIATKYGAARGRSSLRRGGHASRNDRGARAARQLLLWRRGPTHALHHGAHVALPGPRERPWTTVSLNR